VKCIWNCVLDLRNAKRVRQGERLVTEVEHHLATVAPEQEAVREAELTVAEEAVREAELTVAEEAVREAELTVAEEAVREAELTVAEAPLETVKVVPLQTDEDGSGQGA
jgi:hypothetical protein